MLRLWFGFADTVDRATYLRWGIALMAAKYLIDGALVLLFTGSWWPPLQYLSPLFEMRTRGLHRLEAGEVLALGGVTLPFFWIGVSMSVRRAADAGLPPVLGLGFAIPFLNWLTMIGLSLLPSAPEPHWSVQTPGGTARNLKGALIGMVLAIAIGLASMAAVVQTSGAYGLMLFFVTPLLMGTVIGLFTNHPAPRPLSESIFTALLALLLTSGALAVFALEGVICLLMAAPIAVVAALMGAVVGRAIAIHGRHASAPVVLAAATMPLLGMAEHAIEQPTLHEVLSVQDVAAPPDVVWRHVIAFSEMAPPTEWIFRTGIAYPVRARLEGEGVGAIRHCEFSTGAFVEPITAWEPGRRLAFDVASQPRPMYEWGITGPLDPPHLDTLLRSRRGEFRLVALPGGGTRLEGRTWYQLRAAPTPYWQLWADQIIHRIHERVLAHIAATSQQHGRP
jgi:hypothetical protein